MNQAYSLYFCLLQLRYSGLKTYRENGQIKQVVHEEEEVRIPGQMTTWTVKNLQAKMKFEFNISVFFKDSTTGPPVRIITETLINGESLLVQLLLQAQHQHRFVTELQRLEGHVSMSFRDSLLLVKSQY